MQVTSVVFDFGGVLIDWNPRHLFRKIFNEEREMESFLEEVCTDEWNIEQDRGRTLAEGTQFLIEKFPAKEALIKLYYDRWPEMLNGPIMETVEILEALKKYYPVYGLTNWSAETFPIALERYDFLGLLDGILVSGEEKIVKPSPEIFELLVTRYNINPASSIFIDDNVKNIIAAEKAGFQTVHFKNPLQLKYELEAKAVRI